MTIWIGFDSKCWILIYKIIDHSTCEKTFFPMTILCKKNYLNTGLFLRQKL